MAKISGLENIELLVARLEDALDGEDREKDARAILRQVLVARLSSASSGRRRWATRRPCALTSYAALELVRPLKEASIGFTIKGQLLG